MQAPFILALADGTRLALRAGDENAADVLGFLARVAQLPPAPEPLPPGVRRLLVVSDARETGNLPQASGADGVCTLTPPDAEIRRRRMEWTRARSEECRRARGLDAEPLPEGYPLWQQLARLSAAIARETQSRGGVLLHGGLAVYPDLSGSGNLKGPCGVLLAGRSGVGKSTASRRLPPPWRPLADDVSLVVRDGEGRYLAHPWPTWSRFFGEEAGDGSDTWAVEQAVPLRATVILEQDDEDRIEMVGPGHAVALLAELARQASKDFSQGMPLEELGAFNLRRFDNLCALVRAVPSYLLHASREGAFWEEIEGAILQRAASAN